MERAHEGTDALRVTLLGTGRPLVMGEDLMRFEIDDEVTVVPPGS